MAKRIMLLGAGGQVGQALQHETLPAEWQFGAYTRDALDIADHRAMQSEIESYKPDIIINAAAMTAVDQCEKDQAQALAANFYAVANLAAQGSARDIPIIHLSTDYVFDGQPGGTPYKPEDVMHPLNFYGDSKMMGEEALRHELPWHVILRVSAVFSAFGGNILTRALTMLDTKDDVRLVSDQISGPTPAPDVARALIAITGAILNGKGDGFGTFHFCGTPAANRMEFTQAVMEAYAPYTPRRPTLTPILTKDLPGFAPRPLYSVLDCEKIRSVYGIQQPSWRHGLHEAMQTLMQGRKKI